MQISDSIEVGIGLSFIFFLSSLVLTSINEAVETVIKTRGRFLFKGVIELFRAPKSNTPDDAEAIAKTIYQHPLIRGLMRGDVSQPNFKNVLPSYMPTRSFALSLIDQVAKGKLSDVSSKGGAPSSASPVQQLRIMAEGIQNEQVRTAVIHAIDTAGDDMEAVRKNLEQWFDSAMDRVSGWYKRRTQRIIFALGLLTALLLNVNTIIIAQSLSTSMALRQAVMTTATTLESKYAGSASASAMPLTGAVAELDRTSLPIGWSDSGIDALEAMATGSSTPDRLFRWIEILVGYLITAFAVTLGAPFWFDVLNRLMVIRATVKPTEKSPDEASQDPQQSPGSAGPIINNIMPAAPPAGGATASPPPPLDGEIYLTPPTAKDRLFEDDTGNPVHGV